MIRTLHAWLLLALAASLSHAFDKDEVVRRAIDYIQAQRDPRTLTWKPRETAAAILAVTAHNPTWRSGTVVTPAMRQIMNGVRADLMQLLAQEKGILSLDHALLAQYLGVLKLFCDDPADVGGFNLMKELIGRGPYVPHKSPANAALALALCVHELPLEKRHMHRLYMGARCSDLCFERANLNILALSCMRRDQDNYDRDEVNRLLASNVDFLRTKKGIEVTEKATKNIYKTSLAIQAIAESPLHIPFANKFTKEGLSRFQRPDGSFGESVTLTALVVPALTDFTGADIKTIFCPQRANETKSDEVRIHYLIRDAITNSQSLVGDFSAPPAPGSTLRQALGHFEKAFPEVLEIELEDSVFGATIRSLNGISTDPRRQIVWKVYRLGEDKGRQNLNDITYNDGDAFEFRYQRL